MEAMAEVFKCVVCLGRLRDARMCPACSKMCCAACIKRWLQQTPECPHCRHGVSFEQLVNCRWADEVISKLEDMGQSLAAQPLAHAADAEDTCAMHHNAITVYCLACSMCICHSCALWGDHMGHATQDIDIKYNKDVEVISTNLSQLRERQRALLDRMQEVEYQVEALVKQRESSSSEVQIFCESVIAGIDQQLKGRLTSLSERKNELTAETKQLEALLLRVETQLRSKAKSTLITKSPDLLAMFADVQRNPVHSVDGMGVPKLTSEVIPDYVGSSLRIPNFEAVCAAKPTDPIFSEPLRLDGSKWRLKAYPNGTQNSLGSCLSVYLELTSVPPYHDSSLRDFLYEWKIEMLCKRPRTDTDRRVVRQNTSRFEVEECWGFEKFYRLDRLRSDGFIDADGSLTLHFQVRQCSYYHKSCDQARYIRELQRQVREGQRMSQSNEALSLSSRSQTDVRGSSKGSASVSSSRLSVEEAHQTQASVQLAPPTTPAAHSSMEHSGQRISDSSDVRASASASASVTSSADGRMSASTPKRSSSTSRIRPTPVRFAGTNPGHASSIQSPVPDATAADLPQRSSAPVSRHSASPAPVAFVADRLSRPQDAVLSTVRSASSLASTPPSSTLVFVEDARSVARSSADARPPSASGTVSRLSESSLAGESRTNTPMLETLRTMSPSETSIRSQHTALRLGNAQRDASLHSAVQPRVHHFSVPEESDEELDALADLHDLQLQTD